MTLVCSITSNDSIVRNRNWFITKRALRRVSLSPRRWINGESFNNMHTSCTLLYRWYTFACPMRSPSIVLRVFMIIEILLNTDNNVYTINYAHALKRKSKFKHKMKLLKNYLHNQTGYSRGSPNFAHKCAWGRGSDKKKKGTRTRIYACRGSHGTRVKSTTV